MNTLSWKVSKTIPIQCPDFQPDPYTGEYPTFQCLVYHNATITENKTAEFTTVKEAQEFADKAPLSCYDFTLNGKLLKDKRVKPECYTGLVGTNSVTLAGNSSIKFNVL